MHLRQNFLAGLLLAVLAASAIAADKPESVLMKADRDFARATAEKRVEGWMQYMTDDTALLRTPPVVGMESIRAVNAKSFADPAFRLEWEPTHGELFPPGDFGYTTGTYKVQFTAQGALQTERGRYITVWRRQKDGTWKVAGDGGSGSPAVSIEGKRKSH
jgi:ketosteroid isomerase-like protein